MVADQGFNVVGINRLVAGDTAQYSPDSPADFVQKLLMVLEVNEAAGDDVGILEDPAALAAQSGYYNHHSFLGESKPVAENDFADVAYSQAVNHDVESRDGLVGYDSGIFSELPHQAVVGDEGFFRFQADFVLGELRVLSAHEVVAVDGKKETGFYQPHHGFQFLLGRVARGMDVEHLIVVNCRALASEVIFEILDASFVSGHD